MKRKPRIDPSPLAFLTPGMAQSYQMLNDAHERLKKLKTREVLPRKRRKKG